MFRSSSVVLEPEPAASGHMLLSPTVASNGGVVEQQREHDEGRGAMKSNVPFLTLDAQGEAAAPRAQLLRQQQ